MIKESEKYPSFSEEDFIWLYSAINFKSGCSPVIKHHELEKKLYEFYTMPEFKELFQDICPKRDFINPENNYLDLTAAFDTARLLGILTQIRDGGETRSIISCDDTLADYIISKADKEMVSKMYKLFNIMHAEKDNTQTVITKTTDAYVSNNDTKCPKLVNKRNGISIN